MDRHCLTSNGRGGGHPYFEWTEKFVADYDQKAINFDEEILPIEVFEPMVIRLFRYPEYKK
jgi:hypothetical protein